MINKPVRECPVETTKTQVEFVFLCLGPRDDYSAFSKCCGQVAPNSRGQTVHIITNDDKKGSETKYITLHLCITVVSNEFFLLMNFCPVCGQGRELFQKLCSILKQYVLDTLQTFY